MKQCVKCKQILPKSQFNKHKKSKDRLQYRCKDCINEYYKKNPEKCKEAGKKYRKENPKKCAVVNKRWRKENPEKCKEIDRRYRKKNPETCKVAGKKYRKKNPEIDKVAGKKYRKKNPERHVWRAMTRRCVNPMDKDYKNYGGRGIKVCGRWVKSFDNFLKDVGKRPSSAYSIDRIDNDGNYKPGNVKWSTAIEQANNRRPRKI